MTRTEDRLARRLLREIVRQARLRIGTRCLLMGPTDDCDCVALHLEPLGIECCVVAERVDFADSDARGFQLVLLVNPAKSIASINAALPLRGADGRVMLLRFGKPIAADEAAYLREELPEQLSRAGFETQFVLSVDRRARKNWAVLTISGASSEQLAARAA